jgi:hypothetical protein
VRRITVEQRDVYGKHASYDSVRKLLLGNGLETVKKVQWAASSASS